MFINIEDNSPIPVEGYCFINQDDRVEYVRLGTSSEQYDYGDTVYIEDSLGDSCEVYVVDIPKIIKTLQAAYDHKGNP